jgi:hypothetical protein
MGLPHLGQRLNVGWSSVPQLLQNIAHLRRQAKAVNQLYGRASRKVAWVGRSPLRGILGAFAPKSLLSLEVHDLSAVEQTGKFEENQVADEDLPTENVVLLRLLLLALFTLSGTTLALAKDIALVSNKGGTVAGLTMPELVKLCKAQTSRWPDGKAVTVFVRDPASPDMRMILEKVYTGTAGEVSDLISNANHGRANHPAIVIVASDGELVRKVASTPGAIGLVDVYAINSSVEVVKIAGKLPFEPGYPLHGN